MMMTYVLKNITARQLNDIASFLDADRCHELHSELAPCEPVEFAMEYFERWPDEFRQCADLASLGRLLYADDEERDADENGGGERGVIQEVAE